MNRYLPYLLVPLLLLGTSCTQNQKRDGGWAKNRLPKNGGKERPGGDQPTEEPNRPGDSGSSNPGSSGTPTDSGYGTPPVVGELPDNPLIAFTTLNQGDDFVVDFQNVGAPIPPGLIYGMNDLRNASPGAWRVWSDAVTPTGGMLRLWFKYSQVQVDQKHIDTALRAKAAGLSTMVTAVGDSTHKETGIKTGGAHVPNPPDIDRWVGEVVRDVKKLQAAGVDVTHIEIWNEPNLGDPWPESIRNFGDWFAEAGLALREEFGTSIQLGGPGLAGTLGDKLEWPREMFAACKRKGFEPDFYSWHHYGSYPSEHDMLDVPTVVLAEAEKAGIRPPQLILSEWNIGLPTPRFEALDDQRAAHYYMATVVSLARTQVSHASFFFLQDAPWDTKKEFAGESVGVFSLAGAPKALLSGMRMMATAGDLPAAPVERVGGPSNISVFASKEGNQGYILGINTFGGGLERHATRLLRRGGVDLGSLKRSSKQLQAYVFGRAERSSLRKLNLDELTMTVLDTVREEITGQESEKSKGSRTVRIKLQGKPRSIASVQLLDREHGNPIADQEFRRAHAPYANGLNSAAMEATLTQLEREGVAASEVSALRRGMKSSKGQISGVSRETTRRARAVFDEQLVTLADEVPETLGRLACTTAQQVDAKDWATLRGDILELKLPLETSVLVELRW